MSLQSDYLVRGHRVKFTTMGYGGREGVLDAQAVPDKDGTTRWHVYLAGTHVRLTFRVDEMDPAPAKVGPI